VRQKGTLLTAAYAIRLNEKRFSAVQAPRKPSGIFHAEDLVLIIEAVGDSVVEWLLVWDNCAGMLWLVLA
jgi:hypothetical protein